MKGRRRALDGECDSGSRKMGRGVGRRGCDKYGKRAGRQQANAVGVRARALTPTADLDTRELNRHNLPTIQLGEPRMPASITQLLDEFRDGKISRRQMLQALAAAIALPAAAV